nr:acyl-[acyl-carrier-protein] thioesterase [Treponemataceae bacterium]
RGFAILLSRVSFKIIKMPDEAQKIKIQTWEEKAQGLQFIRKYLITGENGEELILGTTTWLLVNPELRRILPPAKFDLRPTPMTQTELRTLDPGKIKLPENAELVENRKMQFSDCDPNGHVNNSRYGAFAIDALFASGSAISEIQGKVLTDFRLNYAKEAHLGDTLAIFSSVESVEDNKTKIIIAGKNAEETSFECEMFWA